MVKFWYLSTLYAGLIISFPSIISTHSSFCLKISWFSQITLYITIGKFLSHINTLSVIVFSFQFSPYTVNVILYCHVFLYI